MNNCCAHNNGDTGPPMALRWKAEAWKFRCRSCPLKIDSRPTDVIPFPDFTANRDLRTFLAVSCVAVFSRSLDPVQYCAQDEDRDPELPERVKEYRTECLNALVHLMEFLEATGHAKGMPDPFDMFMLSHQTFARAVWMYADEQSRRGWPAACRKPLQVKKFLIQDLQDFWGRDQAKEFVNFCSDSLVHSDLVLDFIPTDLQWIADPKDELQPLVNAYTSAHEFEPHFN